jgi:hypothetical protein
MARCLKDFASLLVGIVVLACCNMSIADDGPILMGPDALPPKMAPIVKERQGEVEDVETFGPTSRRGDHAAPRQASRDGASSRRTYAKPSTVASRGKLQSARQAAPQGERNSPAYRQPQHTAATPWSQPGRRIEPGYQSQANATKSRPTPEQIERYRAQQQYRAQMQARNGAAGDPRQQQMANQQRRVNGGSPQASMTSPSSNSSKRSLRSLFEPPATRVARAPGQPRQIAYPGTSGMNRSGQMTSQNRALMYGNYPTGHPSMNYGNMSARGPMPTRMR